jgi:autophagy-related protein 2
MVLRHVILYGISGFPRMGVELNDTWMPDIKQTQLGDVLAGVAPVRSLVNLGSGVKDLVVVPMREYRKDGRIVRSLQKGAWKFAKTTTSELVRLGAKVAVGTQNVLQNAEDFLVPAMLEDNTESTEYLISDSEEEGDMAGPSEHGHKKAISLYADQPLSVAQGLRGAGDSLRRNFGSARDALMAVPVDIAEQGSAQVRLALVQIFSRLAC